MRGAGGSSRPFTIRASPSSTSFVEGRGLYSLGELEPEPFTTWPLGYPLAIAGAAKLTGLSVFWAAKVIDTAAALICIVLLLYALPRTGGMASVAWLSGGIITTFSATYAEGIFILAMLVARHPLLQLLESAQGAALSGCIPGSAVVRVLRPTSVARRGGFRFGMMPTGPGSRASVPRARVVYLRDSRLRPGRC